MKFLVTGGTGFIGKHLIEHLLHEGNEVFALSRKASNIELLSRANLKVVCGDCRDKTSLQKAFENIEGVDYVFHLAGTDRVLSNDEYYQVNFEGTKNLLEVCQKLYPELQRFIYISSIFATGPQTDKELLKEDTDPHPMTHYGKSKLLAEREVERYKEIFPVVIIRPPAVYGPGDRNMYSLFKLLNKGIGLYFGEKKRMFSLCFIDDLINGLILTTQKDYPSGEIFFIADSRVYTLGEIMKTISDALEVKPIYIKIPFPFVIIGSLLLEVSLKIIGKATIFNLEKSNERIKNWACDSSKSQKMLGFEPKYDLKSGAQITGDWYRKNGWLYTQQSHNL